MSNGGWVLGGKRGEEEMRRKVHEVENLIEVQFAL
jgi:hypothetical protein